MILQAARLKIPVTIFTDIKAFLSQDFRKAKKPADIPFLMARVKETDDKPWSRTRYRKDDMAPFRELVYKSRIEDLTKEGKRQLDTLFRYKADFISRLDADLHNTRSHDREAAAKMEKAMRHVKTFDSASFYDRMYEKWRPIQDTYDRDYNRKWHADYEKKNYNKIWNAFEPAFEGSPAFLEEARKRIAKAGKPLAEGWPESENKRYIVYDLAKQMLPVLKTLDGVVDAYADIDPDDRDAISIYLLDEQGVTYYLTLESRKFVNSMGEMQDPITFYPEHVRAGIVPHRGPQSFADRKERARYT
jgi:hypothetical protein